MNAPVRMKLMPGVWLTAIQTRKFKSSFWSVQLLTPLRQETAALTALLPRVLSRGTASCPDQEALGAALDQLYGGAVEPRTFKRGEVHSTGFVATFLDDALTLDGSPIARPAAELLGDLLLRPATRNGRLRADYVDSERNNLLSDIRSQCNDKRTYALQRLVQEMCREEPYGVDRLGDLNSAQAIRVGRLDKHYRTLLAGSQIELYYCGSLSAERIRRAWTEALLGLPRWDLEELPETRIFHHPEEVRRVTECMDVTQTKLAMGFRTQTLPGSGEIPTLLVFNALYGGAPTSKLFQHVREEKSLCYYASSGLDRNKGLMIVQCGVDDARAQEAEKEILAQLEEVREGRFQLGELESARRSVLHQLRAVLDSQGALEHFYSSQQPGLTPVTPEELVSLVEEVTAQDVVMAANRVELDTVYRLTGEHRQGGDN